MCVQLHLVKILMDSVKLSVLIQVLSGMETYVRINAQIQENTGTSRMKLALYVKMDVYYARIYQCAMIAVILDGHYLMVIAKMFALSKESYGLRAQTRVKIKPNVFHQGSI
jgi:hypothetical protein